MNIDNEITWTRTVFKWAYESDMLDRPAKFGPDFKIDKLKKQFVKQI